jgi:hypothetical protein
MDVIKSKSNLELLSICEDVLKIQEVDGVPISSLDRFHILDFLALELSN